MDRMPRAARSGQTVGQAIVEQLVDEYYQLKEQQNDLKKEVEFRRLLILDHLKKEGVLAQEVGDFKISYRVTNSERFDIDKARAILGEEFFKPFMKKSTSETLNVKKR